MDTVTLAARTTHERGGRIVTRGDLVTMTPLEAVLGVNRGQLSPSRVVGQRVPRPAAPSTPPPAHVSTPEHEPAAASRRSRRVYKRRDLVAEQLDHPASPATEPPDPVRE